MRLRPRRPVLRVQLTLIYSSLFLGLLAAVLIATTIQFGSSSAAAGNGNPANPGTTPVPPTHQFAFGAAVIVVIAGILALAGAWWLAGRFLRPLRAIADTAQEISATNLHRRLDLRGPDDELTNLGATLDGLFARLETSFEAQRRFVANASHELRTPLAGQRTLLQVALADPDADTASLRAACEEALQVGDQQERLIDALLTLASSERGIERWERFDLARIAGDVLAARRHEAVRRAIRVSADLAPAPVLGDPRLAESLTANLVDNALRHNDPNGTIEISTAPMDNGEARLTVHNTGPLVPPQEIDRLLQPFQRIGSERQRRHTEGHGLGLAIVRAIAQAHGATLTVRSAPEGGLHVEVTFHP
ncbi:HAMP domain-containing histidine kinase [Actinospica durhamensis]|uniref:histidine kinase n=1 Tax=Actinospica durhamensis TaxID=1508375 RepID=A0A941ETB7_9ACTN|nr:HAMP domain-containing sensor histidine kinase [Actinospica durhamensis]MBR7836062.1 HAMP domain-containing histidine kinase [Actinospica durhamensis]